MKSWKVLVHNLAGSGIVNEKSLSSGDIITSDHISDESALKFEKLGWIERVEVEKPAKPAKSAKPAKESDI